VASGESFGTVSMDRILIESIEFYAYHGASDAEQSIGHRYSVDAELRFDLRAAALTDDLAKTVNYSAVAKRIVAVGTTEQFRLIESLAERIAQVILAEFPLESIKLRVRKIRPPMNVIATSVGVEIERSR
jgi:7,8-dihydroneopterin aldolase/epimerase/oxygenase